MKKFTGFWKFIGATLLTAAFVFCLTGAVRTDAAVAAPESPTQPTEITVFTYRGHSADELGLPESQAARLASCDESQVELYMTAYLLSKWDAESNGESFVPEQYAERIASNQAMLTDGSLDAESVQIRKRKAECILQAQGKSEAEAAALWEAFDAYAAGFNRVADYRAWKADWEARTTPTSDEIAAWARADAQNEQTRRESNGNYMGCDPDGP